MLLDIDHFKRVNDTYGHQAGDRVLSYLGRLVLHAVREADIPTRYGGEELLIIAPNTTLASAAALAERLRQHVETHELVLSSESNARQEIRITVSIGVASLAPGVANSRQLIGDADAALYRAKQEGRNRVVANGASAPRPANPATQESR